VHDQFPVLAIDLGVDDRVNDLGRIHPLRALTTDADNQIAGFQMGLGGRRAVDRRNYLGNTILN
jgi:hypothetical protein